MELTLYSTQSGQAGVVARSYLVSCVRIPLQRPSASCSMKLCSVSRGPNVSVSMRRVVLPCARQNGIRSGGDAISPAIKALMFILRTTAECPFLQQRIRSLNVREKAFTTLCSIQKNNGTTETGLKLQIYNEAIQSSFPNFALDPSSPSRPKPMKPATTPKKESAKCAILDRKGP